VKIYAKPMPRLVLIVDDSETCAETLQVALESIHDIEPRVVRNLSAALDACRETTNEIAALLTDLHIASGNGFDLIAQLRKEPRFARVPVLLISGDSDPLLPARARAAGVDAFIPKPYSPSAVRRKLEELICSGNH
jgi:PleD family two-component response regulator